MTCVNLVCVVGARPNFVKMAPLLRALEVYRHVHCVLVHTGQHYDDSLSRVFFEQLGMRSPDVSLEAGSGKHGVQTARVLERMEAVLEQGTPRGDRFDRVVVVGDVNSTMAAALAAVKLGIPVAHVEAGLRSSDRSMPEEINRIVTDAVSDMLFVSEPSGMDNLRREGHPEAHLHLVGNLMIDTVLWALPRVQASGAPARYGLQPRGYAVVTLHRAENVDSPETLGQILEVLAETSRSLPVVFPIHPRTRQRIELFGLASTLARATGILTLPPLAYLDFLALTSEARVIITDSGGLQEESTMLGIPCLTMRSSTERPITIEEGTSTLVGSDPERLYPALDAVLKGSYKHGRCPSVWDGLAGHRIARVLSLPQC